jgi:hypothetical protein
MGHSVHRSRRSCVIGACAAGLAAFLGACTAGEPTAKPPPDSGAAQLKATCYAGVLEDCDELARIVPKDTDIWVWAATCGGRLDSPGARCTEQLPQAPLPSRLDVNHLSSPGLDLARECERGKLAACDSVTALAEPPPELLEYGRTCGGRVEKRTATTCVEELGDTETLPEPSPADGLDAERRDRLGALAYRCLGLDLAACDTLAVEARGGYEPYREFATSCGDRLSAATGSCAAESKLAGIPAADDPTDVEDETEVDLRELAIACGDGDYASCAALVERAEAAEYAAFRRYGRTCGGRPEGDRPSECLEALGEEGPGTVTAPDGTTENGDDAETETLPRPTVKTKPPPLPTTTFAPPSATVQPPPLPPASPDAPKPTRAQEELLAAINEEFDRQAPEIYELQTGDLRVGGTSRLVLLLRQPVKVRLSPRVRDLADERGEIRVGIRPTLHAADPGAIAIEQPEGRTTLRIRVRTREAVFSGGEIGRFAASPADAGTPQLWLLVADPEINGETVSNRFYLTLGGIEVEDEPFWKRFWKQLVVLAFVLTTLGTLYRYLVAPFLRKRREQAE